MRVCHIFRPHVGAQFPRDDIAAVIIQDRAEIEPAPADDLQISEVSLPLARQAMFTSPKGGAG